MQIELDEPEASLLYRVVRNRLRELRVEVRHTRNSDSRAYMLHKERLLTRILERFPPLDEEAHVRGYELDTTSQVV